MMEPTLLSYAGIPGTIGLAFLVLLSLALFAARAIFWYRILRLSKAEFRLDKLWSRLGMMARDVLLQPRFRDRTSALHNIVWPVHLAIFWGFVVFAVSFVMSVLRGLFPSLPLPWPEDIGPLALALDLFGVTVLFALCIAALRRYALKPEGVKRTVDAAIILSLIGLVMLTSLSGGAGAVAHSGHGDWRPVSQAIASVLGLDSTAGRTLFLASWWIHIAIVLGFFSYLPYSKHFHLLVSPFSVFLADVKPKGRMRDDGEAISEQQFDLRDFTWRELLSPLACAECGRCDRACPAHGSGEALSPQDLVHGMKEHLLEAGPALARGANGRHAPRTLYGDIIQPEQLWACATCYSCMEHCPVRNEHLPLIYRMRRREVALGHVDPRVQDTLIALTRHGNSFGQSERARAKWTAALPFKIPDARKQHVRFLWFVGDTASYDQRIQESTRATARILHAAGCDYGILYESERNAGNDARRIGEEGLFQMLAEKNIAALSKCAFDEIITTDPHTLNTLRNEYPALGAAYRVRHHTEVFRELLDTGALVPGPLELRAAYHDACYLGRYNNVYDDPRAVLRAIGVDLVELPRNRRDAYCCGAGGGRIWMEDKPGAAERPAESRVREAAAQQGVQVLVAACPKDVVMFQDAVKTTDMSERIEIREISDLVWQSVSVHAVQLEEA